MNFSKLSQGFQEYYANPPAPDKNETRLMRLVTAVVITIFISLLPLALWDQPPLLKVPLLISAGCITYYLIGFKPELYLPGKKEKC